jgi:hypothetical protein
VGTPSDASYVSCIGIVSQSSGALRSNENVSCTIYALDSLLRPTIASPADFQPAIINGGVQPTALMQGPTITTVVFTVVAPPSVGTLFAVTGRLANGTLFTQGALLLPVGECMLIFMHHTFFHSHI